MRFSTTTPARQLKRLALCLLGPFFVLAACGGATDSDGAAGPGPAGAAGCQSNADCAQGWCVGSAGCGTPWSCVTEIPCSAAAPFYACDCSGRVSSRAAGCPGSPYDRRLNHYGYEEGSLCPVNLRVRLQGPGFDGARIRAKLSAPGDDDATLEYAAGMMAEATGSLEFEDGAYVGEEEQALFVWLDTNENSVCDAAELSWSVSVATSVPTQRLDVTLDVKAGLPCPTTL